MKKLSVWAKHHRHASRFIIVISFILLIILGIVTGVLLDSLNVSIPVLFLLAFACCYCAAFITYPSRFSKRKASNFYVLQKSRDLILAGSTFLMIVFLGNHQEILFHNSFISTEAMASKPAPSKIDPLPGYRSLTAFAASMRDQNGKPLKWKERKKLLMQQVKAIKKAKDISKGTATLLIILSVLIAVLLVAAIAALACNISCSGSGALAIVVALGGTALVVWLLIVVIKGILRKQKGSEKKQG